MYNYMKTLIILVLVVIQISYGDFGHNNSISHDI